MPDKKSKAANADPIADPKIHRRLLRFINTARGPDDLAWTPNEREVGNEEEEHANSAEKESDLKPVFAPNVAQAMIDARDRVSPVRGFANVNEALALSP